ncbi:Tetrapyrrole (Corrin/Porphyrin) Methylases [Actinopolyspora xinjiangensis]|uniref:Tetrapyrrole (Corrin/Porphyrin) Methylases n=1 Tax=Actinopolyspora xinjiangensis TaxID=405564 RepID=A0A1H0SYK4_9ACTN|nr:SAM-dependent methyltransferase [Actinopolyspora xinjiangensis]SDP46288.1 Tetrapyrrole (Corrin/Porphyrin) Methylases [Actinopolyspora xinjiangensis]
MTSGTRTGLISFVGAGPGAADLMTLRAARRISEADIVLWSPSVVSPECVREHARAEAELVDTDPIDQREVHEIYRRAERERLRVARLHAGDSAVWSSVQQQYDFCARMELEVEIVPGVSGHTAAAASVGKELTGTEHARPVMVSKLDGGSSAVPDAAAVREFAEQGMTMALSVSAARTGQLVERLRAAGYADDVPVVVAYKVTCSDELVLRTTLGELEGVVKEHKLWRQTLFLVGDVLRSTAPRSRSYASGRSRGGATSGGRYADQEPGWRGGAGPRYSAGRGTARGSSSRRGSDEFSHDGDGPLPRPRSDEQRGGARADADVAWWAVRDWQQNARDTVRPTGRGGAVRQPAVAEPQSPDLFTVSDGAEAGDSDIARVQGEAGGDCSRLSGNSAVESGADSAAESDESAEPTSSGEAPPEEATRTASPDDERPTEREGEPSDAGEATEELAADRPATEEAVAEAPAQAGTSTASAGNGSSTSGTRSGSRSGTSAKSGARSASGKTGGGRTSSTKSGSRTKSQQKNTASGGKGGSSNSASGKRRTAE